MSIPCAVLIYLDFQGVFALPYALAPRSGLNFTAKSSAARFRELCQST